MKSYTDLLMIKDRLLEEHWNGRDIFTRDELWVLFDLIERIEKMNEELHDELYKIENSTLGGVVHRMLRGKK